LSADSPAPRSRLRQAADSAAAGTLSAGLSAVGVPPWLAGVAGRLAVRHKKLVAFVALVASPQLFVPMLVVLVVVGSLTAVVVAGAATSPRWQATPSALAEAQIPHAYLSLYEQVGAQYEVPWSVLAGVGEVATAQGTVNPYDPGSQEATSYPITTPPIGGGPGQGAGPMLLPDAAVRAASGHSAQDVAASVRTLAHSLAAAARQLADSEGTNYDEVFTSPVADHSQLWTQAVAATPVRLVAPCAAPAGTPAAAQIEYVVACEVISHPPAGLRSAAGPWPGQPAAQLVAEALMVSWAFSRWGAAGPTCTDSAGHTVHELLPLPPQAAVACDQAAMLAASAAAVASRAQADGVGWDALGGVVLQPLPAGVMSPTCAAAVAGVLGTLPEPGPYSPSYPGAPVDFARAGAAWASPLNPFAGVAGPCAPLAGKGFEAALAALAGETLVADEVLGQTQAQTSDLAGLVAFLVHDTAEADATLAAGTVLPRLAPSPAVLTLPPVPLAAPLGASGWAAQAVADAAGYEAATGATCARTGGSGVPVAAGTGDVATPDEHVTLRYPTPANWAQWATDELEVLGDPLTASNVNAMAAWGQAEGGAYANPDAWNMLNTTRNTDSQGRPLGGVPTNAAGVLSFPSPIAGLVANAATIDQANMAPIAAAFASGDASGRLAAALAVAPWGTDPMSVARLLGQSYDAAGPSLLHGTAACGPAGGLVLPGDPRLARFVQAAESQVGVPYQWGGQTQGQGFDCSGLVDWALAQAGIAIPGVDLGGAGAHGATAQQLYDATAASAAAGLPEPGDLVFFGASATQVAHVGIYVGDNLMIDAPSTGETVRIEPYTWPDLLVATVP